MRRDEEQDDEHDDDGLGVVTPTGRTYEHEDCGGKTIVSGGDFTHICDPFWPCTSTYCCGCGDFVSLSEVRWASTGETVSKFRRRMRRKTPGFLKAWRLGVGLLFGGALGAAAALLVVVLGRVAANSAAGIISGGAIGGAIVIYLLGTFLLNRAFGIDYRRMR